VYVHRIPLLFLCGLVVLGCTGSATTPQPPVASSTHFESAKGKFKVNFHGKAVREGTRDGEGPFGPFTLYTFAVEVEPGFGYVVVYCDYPEDFVKSEPAQEILGRVRDGQSEAGKILKDGELIFGKDTFPARDFFVEKPKDFRRVRIILAGPRLYQLVVFGTPSEVNSKEADQFFDSFEITK
jgi:hypothetical protein